MSVNRYLIGAQILGLRPAEEVIDAEPSDGVLLEQAAREVEAAISPPEAAQPPASRALPSELDGVSDEAWTQWVTTMKVAEPTTIAKSGALGMFAIKPRRLADLGLMQNVAATNVRKTGHLSWEGEWTAPLSQAEFLGNPRVQYRVLVASTQAYAAGIEDGSIACPEGLEDMTLSGALALLTKCGPTALASWAEADKRKPSTVDLFKVTNGLF